MELTNVTLKSLGWKAVEKGSANLLQFIIGLILARLLLPSDYGVMAIVMVFIAIAQIFIEAGFSDILVQKVNKTEADYSTMFITNIFVSIILYLLLYCTAPLISSFYGSSELTHIIRVVSLMIVIGAFNIVQRTKTLVDLNFGFQAKASFFSVLISGIVGVSCAYSGFGVWALVWQTLAYTFINTLLYWIFINFKFKLIFSRESFLYLLNKGLNLIGSGLVNTFYANLYPLIIGKKFTSSDLGFFTRGKQMAYLLPSNVTDIFSMTIYPIFCKIQSEERFPHVYLTYIRLICFCFFPIMVIMIVEAEDLIIFLLSEKWQGSAFFFQILLISYMFDPLMRLNSMLPTIKGRTDYTLKCEFYKKISGIGVLLLSIPFGLKVMCIGLSFYCIIDIAISSYFVNKIIMIGFFDIFRSIGHLLVLSIFMYLILEGVHFMISNIYLNLIVVSVLGIAIHLSVAKICKMEELYFLINIIKRKK